MQNRLDPDSYILFRSSLGQRSNMLNPVIMEKNVETEKWKKCVSTIWNNVKSVLTDPAFYGCFNGNFLFMTLYGIFRHDPNLAHDCFVSLAGCFDRFLSSLSSLPESTIEIIKSSVKSFHTDLKYWESCLKEHKGQSLNAIEFVMPTLPVQNNIAPRTFGYT